MLNSIPELLEQSKRLRNILEKSYATSLSLSDCQAIMAQVHKFRNLSEVQAHFSSPIRESLNRVYVVGGNYGVRQAIVAKELRQYIAEGTTVLACIPENTWPESISGQVHKVPLHSSVFLPSEVEYTIKDIPRVVTLLKALLASNIGYSGMGEMLFQILTRYFAANETLSLKALRTLFLEDTAPVEAMAFDKGYLTVQATLRRVLTFAYDSEITTLPLPRAQKPVVLVGESRSYSGEESALSRFNALVLQEYFEKKGLSQAAILLDADFSSDFEALGYQMLTGGGHVLIVSQFQDITENDYASVFMENIELFTAKPSFSEATTLFPSSLTYLGLKCENPSLALQLKPYELMRLTKTNAPQLVFLR